MERDLKLKPRNLGKPHIMKTKVSLLAALAAATLAGQPLLAQPPAASPPPPSRQTREPIPPPPPPSNGAAQQIDGTIAQYLLNPNGEADGLLLMDGTQIKFPPHMSADLVRTVKPNDSIAARGNREQSQVFHAFTITNTATNASVVEARPSEFARRLPPELRGVNLKPMEAGGNIKAVLHAPRGEVEGAVLADGTVIRIQPEAGAQFANLFVKGAAVSVKGYGTTNALGRALLVTEIGASGQTLTSIYGAGSAAPAGPQPPPPPGME